MKLNKHEVIGILGSIIVMALALHLFYGDSKEREVSLETDEEVAVELDTASELEKALKRAHRADGTLTELVIQDVRLGTGDRRVVVGDTLRVDYIGATTDGVPFDSSYERNQPFVFTVGRGTVIEGWEKGLVGMKIGGQRILVIPSDMAYGNRQVGAIGPNTPLVFAVELLDIR